MTPITPGPRQMGWMSSDPYGLRAAGVLPSWAGDMAQFPDQLCSSSEAWFLGIPVTSHSRVQKKAHLRNVYANICQMIVHYCQKAHGFWNTKKVLPGRIWTTVRRKILVILILKENGDMQRFTCWAKRPRSQNTQSARRIKDKVRGLLWLFCSQSALFFK